MKFTQKTIKTIDELKAHIKTHEPSFYFSSKTSTVIPYDKLGELLPWNDDRAFYLCDLSKMPSSMELTSRNTLKVKGAVSWEDAKKFLQTKSRAIMTSPTEQLALILAGVATSCTGERCFAFGNMRKQIHSITYVNSQGEEVTLKKEELFKTTSNYLRDYQKDFSHYIDFKNAPYPRFEKSIDLMIGTEGQLGVITEVELDTTSAESVNHVFILIPRWEENYQGHLEIFNKVQAYRGKVLSCELLDANCMNYLKADEKLGVNEDVIFMEILGQHFEEVYADLLCNFENVSIDQVFEITPNKFHHVRASVPRAIFEENSKMGVVKQGTDVQVRGADFSKLFDFYREASKIGVKYCLFGHFGDAHLHFNYMPTPVDAQKCSDMLKKLYHEVVEWRGSPFAEHGIGLLKQKFIKDYWSSNQTNLFRDLKKEHDPHNQFFPQGFMNL